MGIWGKLKEATQPKPWQPPQGIDIEQVGQYFGLPGRVIVREADELADLYCDNLHIDGMEPGLFYPCVLVNRGQQVTVIVGGRQVAVLDQRCLPDAVEVLRASGGKQATALVSPREPARKTAQVIAKY